MKTIRQTATIRGATPHDLYETIMDSKLHSKLSRQRTTMSRRVGGAFKVGHDLEGKNLRLTANPPFNFEGQKTFDATTGTSHAMASSAAFGKGS